MRFHGKTTVVYFCAVWLILCRMALVGDPVERVPVQIESLGSIEGLEDWDWTHARTAFVDSDLKYWVTTMSQTTRTGSHGYHDIYESISRDGGQSWTQPRLVPSLRRSETDDGYALVPGDLWPTWHATSGTLLVTGKTFNFEGGRDEDFLREAISYAVRPIKAGSWSEMRTVEMPSRDREGFPILAPNAGCNQPFTLSNGEILLPVRYQRDQKLRNYTSIVARCEFDGQTLKYLTHGSEHSISEGRGLYEPSLTRFRDRFFLTLRADDGAYVCRGEDGIHFDPVREWRFDDGSLLGSYNTQQHWVTVGGGLFLVYTRRGADNDHIFRHRAPLFIAQVNPEELVVIKDTERVLLAENDACLGNSGICRVSEQESWVSCGEVRVNDGVRKGEKNRVLFARIRADYEKDP